MSATPSQRNEVTTAPAFSDQDYQDQADFRCAIRKFIRFSEEQARSKGITPQQHMVLLTVRGHHAHPHVSVGDIAEALQIRHHSASLLVDRCVKRGLIRRSEDPDDRRRALLTLTAEGQRVLDAITHANRGQIRSIHRDLFRDSLVRALEAYDAQSEP